MYGSNVPLITELVNDTNVQFLDQDDDDDPDTIRTAERKFGFQTGVRRSHDGDIIITVRLEPEVEFFATPCDFGGRPTGAVRPMTPSLYENTWGMFEEPVPLDLSVLERS